MRRLVQIILLKPILWFSRKFTSRPERSRIFKALSDLFRNIKEEPGKKGVVLSLKENMDALVISPSEDRRVAIIKLKPGNVQSAIATIKDAYSKVAPVYPFEYSFLDQKFDELYRKDLRQQTILTVFAGMAIFIACLGLFGLASFTATKRFKEIGVRKVLGSSVQSIVMLLSKDLLKPVIIAAGIALPVGYYAMYKWLQNFAYRIQIEWWIFLLAGLVALMVALLTVSVQAIKAAVAKPVESLRTE